MKRRDVINVWGDLYYYVINLEAANGITCNNRRAIEAHSKYIAWQIYNGEHQPLKM